MQFSPIRGFVRLSINRPAIHPDLGGDDDWKAEITWEELMRCKREIGQADRDAVEILPRDRDVVSDFNMRHIWLLPMSGPDPLPFIWRRREKKLQPYRKPSAEEARDDALMEKMREHMRGIVQSRGSSQSKPSSQSGA